MPPFIHPSLLAIGLPILAAPVLIHLINMLRHRRVEWAAMEFLRLSQKKHRTWVILKQLLLLLLRMLAIAVVVFMVAQPLLPNQWGNLFLGTDATHHIVLWDDSFSMGDHWGDTTAFDQGKAVVQRIGDGAARERRSQFFSLLRFSRAGQYGGGLQPDYKKQSVDALFAAKVKDALEPMEVSQMAAEPLPALDALEQLFGPDDGARRILYLVSDFRTRQWSEPTDLKERLRKLSDAKVEIHLVDCVETARPNLAITALVSAEGIRAAGVPWYMEISVHNFGTTLAQNVPIVLLEDDQAVPGVTIAKIPPGETVKERFQVNFPLAGSHKIEARLPRDAVAADNVRYAVVDVQPELPVLLVDGAAKSLDAERLSWAMAPGGPVRTGIRPRIETPQFLAKKPLDEFGAITVANVDRLDRSAVEALERYAEAGGGVAFFLGEKSNAKWINEELYRGGKGLFPLPLAGPTNLLVDRLEKAPDMEAEKHFIFRIFTESRNSFLSMVQIERYFAMGEGWTPPADSGTQVIARLRNGAPLAVERNFGRGRAIAFLTTAAPRWNNWGRNNPSYVIVVQELQAYLSRRPGAAAAHQVGEPLEVQLDPAQYRPQVHFVKVADSAPVTVDAAGNERSLVARLAQTDHAGFYEARLDRNDGRAEVRRFGFNVDPAEGDLTALFGPELAERLHPQVTYQFERATTFQSTTGEMAGLNLSDFLLYLLVALLIGEQALAWSASYHTSSRRPQRPAVPGQSGWLEPADNGSSAGQSRGEYSVSPGGVS